MSSKGKHKTHNSNPKKRRQTKKRNEENPYVAGRKIFAHMLQKSFQDIPEERRCKGGNFRYRINDFILAVIIAMVRGSIHHADAIVQFWEHNKDFLHSLGLFVNDEAISQVPSLATFYRLVVKIDPDMFREVFFRFVTRLVVVKTRKRGLQILSVDGKTMRGTSCGKSGKPIHILTAFYNVLSIPVGCVSCAEKSNEITAWGNLLDTLKTFCKDMIFTSDAMGCQAAIVAKIIKCGGNYCLALKGNHPNFEKEAKDMMRREINHLETYREKESLSHGRIERRVCTVYNADPENKNSYITGLEKWIGIKRLIQIEVYKTDKKTGMETISDERIYISNLDVSAQTFNEIIRSHWQVEIFHYILDVDFRQDSLRRRNDETNRASRNLDMFQKAAYIILKLYDILLSKLDGDRRRLGIKKMINRTNASNRMVSEIFNLSMDWFDDVG